MAGPTDRKTKRKTLSYGRMDDGQTLMQRLEDAKDDSIDMIVEKP